MSRELPRRTGAGSDWSLTPVGPDGDDAGFFSSRHWASALACLGARCWYRLGEGRDDRLFVFRRGPLKVAFPGFPVTPAGFTPPSSGWPERIDLLRTNHSCLDPHEGQVSAGRTLRLPESVIPLLSEWPRRNAKKLAKDVAYSRRQPVRLAPALPADADGIFDIYRSTVSRHGGSLRYNREYFRRLLAPGQPVAPLCMRVVRSTTDDHLAGFCIAASDHGRGYYLHGGVDLRYRSLGVSDLLLDEAIAWAIGAGCKDFTLMASPPDQPGLVSFKRKWSEQEGSWTTVDSGLTLPGRWALAAMGLRARVGR